jgi:hypothetical protein
MERLEPAPRGNRMPLIAGVILAALAALGIAFVWPW